jgi:hypothetical protein
VVDEEGNVIDLTVADEVADESPEQPQEKEESPDAQ